MLTRVTVDALHIKAARDRDDDAEVAIALAFLAAVPGAFGVTVYRGEVTVGFAVGPPVRVALPPEVAVFAAALERGERVVPFVFEVEVAAPAETSESGLTTLTAGL